MVTTFVDYDHDLGPFPLMHSDFNSQNILIDDECNIVGVIDWEWSSTVPLQSLCQYPFFIVDNPFDVSINLGLQTFLTSALR
ncbi:hypothetical protein BC937DRAFT_93741 [Endogone sp. FLAS-F59071]|nr:hypothetical protein BC937DRAFT_93741 [Endogone sp. FLAS-F59071]|eukprot:RUS14490.1 hypothetical protein BC937DRAFT_93741 [Endogone sp. FLAS-F59071]